MYGSYSRMAYSCNYFIDLGLNNNRPFFLTVSQKMKAQFYGKFCKSLVEAHGNFLRDLPQTRGHRVYNTTVTP